MNTGPVFMGVDMSSGPDLCAIVARVRQQIIDVFFIPPHLLEGNTPMARNGPHTKPVEKLDTNGASAIYKAMIEFDSIIDKQQQIINNANLDIVKAMGKMERAYAERKNLSDQLDKFAPDDFMQPRDTDGAAMAPATSPYPTPFHPAPPAAPYPYGYSPKPWHKPSPMPQRVRSVPTPAFTDGEF